MKYLLDTNICISYLNNRSTKVKERLLKVSHEDVSLCSVVKAELYFGAQKSKFPQKSIQKVEEFISYLYSYSFNDSAAREYGIIRAKLESKGTPIGPNYLMIAAIAKANDLILVTNNIKEFERVDNLKLEDWST